MGWLSRSELILGEENINKLANSRVAILGLGGVGSAVAEAIARAGIGHILLVDSDIIDETNINRQLIATGENIGKDKTEETYKRLASINPNAEIKAIKSFYLPDNSEFLFEFNADYIIDAIDTVTAKLHLAKECEVRKIRLICCLGTGNRIDPTQIVIGDISDTAGYGCPLARIIRRELKKRDVAKLKVVYSKEMPMKSLVADGSPVGRHSPGSTAFVPPTAGFIMASYVVRDLLGMV